MMKNAIKIGVLMAGAVALSGCATVSTLAEHGKLEASSKMSSSIFLDPVSPDQQTVFLQVHNTTDKTRLGLRDALASRIEGEGWKIVNDPRTAKFILQVNVLQAGKIKANALQSALAGGYGGVLGSAGVGGAMAALSGGDGTAIGGAALGVGAADFVGGLLVKDVTYSVITDVRVLERGAKGQTFTVHHNVAANSGSSSQSGNLRSRLLSAFLGSQNNVQSNGNNVQSSTSQSYTTQSKYKIYQTRVATYADQVNLDWKGAEPVIRKGLVRTIGGLF